jgi:hypothetical protein
MKVKITARAGRTLALAFPRTAKAAAPPTTTIANLFSHADEFAMRAITP